MATMEKTAQGGSSTAFGCGDCTTSPMKRNGEHVVREEELATKEKSQKNESKLEQSMNWRSTIWGLGSQNEVRPFPHTISYIG